MKETTVTVIIRDPETFNTSTAMATAATFTTQLDAVMDAGIQALLGAMLAHGFAPEHVGQLGDALNKAKEEA
jgi:hypothetical protein